MISTTRRPARALGVIDVDVVTDDVDAETRRIDGQRPGERDQLVGREPAFLLCRGCREGDPREHVDVDREPVAPRAGAELVRDLGAQPSLIGALHAAASCAMSAPSPSGVSAP